MMPFAKATDHLQKNNWALSKLIAQIYQLEAGGEV